MNFPLQSKTHPSEGDSLDWGQSLRPSVTSEYLRILRNERRKYKNISIYVTELPATSVHDFGRRTTTRVPYPSTDPCTCPAAPPPLPAEPPPLLHSGPPIFVATAPLKETPLGGAFAQLKVPIKVVQAFSEPQNKFRSMTENSPRTLIPPFIVPWYLLSQSAASNRARPNAERPQRWPQRATSTRP
jgi:hypothetical protein